MLNRTTTSSMASKPSNIKVAVRVRPILASEIQKGVDPVQEKLWSDNTLIRIKNDRNANTKQYQFDQVFDARSDQAMIYRRTRIDFLIKQVVQGFHATVFVYGQTGSGKTFTMEGYKYSNSQTNPDVMIPSIVKQNPVENQYPEEGLIPRSIRDLFEQVAVKRANNGQNRISVYIQYIQLYNEKVYDLLNSQAYKVNSKKELEGVPGLKVKLNPNTDEVTIENVYVFECHDMQDAFKYFYKGLKNKIMSSHNMNNSSSRSHCILTFTVFQQDKHSQETQLVSKLQLVDLAGSERQQHTQGNKTVDSKTFKEAVEINKSLFTLRQVISALTDNSSKINQANANQSGSKHKIDALQYVPYRESKLTTILKQSLGGNSFTLMIACLSPLDFFADENISTLNYATRAQRINNIPKMNIDPKMKQIMEQKKVIERLQQELKRTNDQVKFLTMGGCACKHCDYHNQSRAAKGLPSEPKALTHATSHQDPHQRRDSQPRTSAFNHQHKAQNETMVAHKQLEVNTSQPAMAGRYQDNLSPNLKSKTGGHQGVPIEDFNVSQRNDHRADEVNQASHRASSEHKQISPINSRNNLAGGQATMISSRFVEMKQQKVAGQQNSTHGSQAQAHDTKEASRREIDEIAEQMQQRQKQMSNDFHSFIQQKQQEIHKLQSLDVNSESNQKMTDDLKTDNSEPFYNLSQSLAHATGTQQVKTNPSVQKDNRLPGVAGDHPPLQVSGAFNLSQYKRTGEGQSNLSITQSQFLALQDQQRSRLGLPTLVGSSAGYSQDRLIASISIIKEVLISNMQLREDLINLTQDHENTMQQNFQYTVENEDLRDRMNLIGQGEGVSIDYLPYVPPMQLEKVINSVNDKDQLEAAKNMILSYFFSIRKDNRNLARRIKQQEDNIKAQRAAHQLKAATSDRTSVLNKETLGDDGHSISRYSNNNMVTEHQSVMVFEENYHSPKLPEEVVVLPTSGSANNSRHQKRKLDQINQNPLQKSMTYAAAETASQPSALEDRLEKQLAQQKSIRNHSKGKSQPPFNRNTNVKVKNGTHNMTMIVPAELNSNRSHQQSVNMAALSNRNNNDFGFDMQRQTSDYSHPMTRPPQVAQKVATSQNFYDEKSTGRSKAMMNGGLILPSTVNMSHVVSDAQSMGNDGNNYKLSRARKDRFYAENGGTGSAHRQQSPLTDQASMFDQLPSQLDSQNRQQLATINTSLDLIQQNRPRHKQINKVKSMNKDQSRSNVIHHLPQVGNVNQSQQILPNKITLQSLTNSKTVDATPSSGQNHISTGGRNRPSSKNRTAAGLQSQNSGMNLPKTTKGLMYIQNNDQHNLPKQNSSKKLLVQSESKRNLKSSSRLGNVASNQQESSDNQQASQRSNRVASKKKSANKSRSRHNLLSTDHQQKSPTLQQNKLHTIPVKKSTAKKSGTEKNSVSPSNTEHARMKQLQLFKSSGHAGGVSTINEEESLAHVDYTNMNSNTQHTDAEQIQKQIQQQISGKRNASNHVGSAGSHLLRTMQVPLGSLQASMVNDYSQQQVQLRHGEEDDNKTSRRQHSAAKRFIQQKQDNLLNKSLLQHELDAQLAARMHLSDSSQKDVL